MAPPLALAVLLLALASFFVATNASLPSGFVARSKSPRRAQHLSLMSFESEAEEEAIRSKYTVPDKAAIIRSIRFYGPKKFTDVDDTDYIIGIAAQAGPGVLGAVLTVLVCFCFCVCRHCCGKCGGKDPKKEGYITKERWYPYLIAVAFCCAAGAFSIVGYVYNHQLTDSAFSTQDGMLTAFTGILDNARSLIGDVGGLFTDIVTQIDTSVPQITNLLDDTSVLATGTTGVIDRLGAFADSVAGLQVTVPGEPPVSDQTYECEFCQTTAVDIQNVEADLRSDADDIINDMDSTVSDVRSSVLDVQNTIRDSVTDGRSTLEDVSSQVGDAQSSLDDGADTARKYNEIRQHVVDGILALPFLILLCMVLGGIMQSKWPFVISYIIVGVTMFIMFLLLAVHFPIATAAGDGCVYANEKEPTIRAEFSSNMDDTSGDVVVACMLNRGVIDALNMTDDFDFANRITFPDLPNITEQFKFTQLNDYHDQVKNLNISTFNIGSTAPLFDALHQLTGSDRFNESTIYSCDPSAYAPESVSTQVNYTRGAIITLMRAHTLLNDRLVEIQQNFSSIIDSALNLTTQAAAFQAKFEQMRTITEPFVQIGKEALDIAYCGFAGDGYLRVKKAFCGKTVESLSVMSMVFFFIPLCLAVVGPLCIVLAKRWPNPDTGDLRKFDDHDVDNQASPYMTNELELQATA